MSLFLLVVFCPLTVADEATARGSGCLGCHQIDKKTVGPAIKDIAGKYGDGDVDALVATVKAGRGPNELQWGTVPMPPSPAPEADVRTVVQWMLSQ